MSTLRHIGPFSMHKRVGPEACLSAPITTLEEILRENVAMEVLHATVAAARLRDSGVPLWSAAVAHAFDAGEAFVAHRRMVLQQDRLDRDYFEKNQRDDVAKAMVERDAAAASGKRTGE